MVRYVRVLKIEKRYEPARGALLIKTMIDTNNFYSSLNLRETLSLIKISTFFLKLLIKKISIVSEDF